MLTVLSREAMEGSGQAVTVNHRDKFANDAQVRGVGGGDGDASILGIEGAEFDYVVGPVHRSLVFPGIVLLDRVSAAVFRVQMRVHLH